MAKKEKKKVTIRELPAKFKIIRQIPREEHQSQRSSGLERREEEIEREIVSTPSQANPIIIRSSPQSQAVSGTGNTALQQSPQEDSQEVRRWYSQTAAQAERKYQTQNTTAAVIPQDTTFGRDPFNRSQDLQNVSGQSIDDKKNYDLSKSPEKKDSRRRYPWEI
jgi:hypothetical protein